MKDKSGQKTATVAVAAAIMVAGCASQHPAASPGASGTPGLTTSARPATARPTVAASSAAPSPAPSAQPVVARCGAPDVAARTFMLRTTDGVPIAAVEVGAGPRGVVLLPELSPLSLCGWWEYAAYLSRSGFHVLLFDHRCAGDSGCTSAAADPSAVNGLMLDISAAAGRLRHDGASKVVLIGASQGASEALIAATRPPAGVAGIVVLSADELTDPLAGPPYPDTGTKAATQVRLPALFAVANEDPAVSVADTRALVASVPATQKRLLIESVDAGHGWDMVEQQSLGSGRPALSRVIIRFLRLLLG